MSSSQASNVAAKQSSGWLDRVLSVEIKIDWAVIILLLLVVIAVGTRFYDLDARVMSHDENTHVYFSWLLANRGHYAQDPLSHGPLQFHLIALSYFLFGDNDGTARVPAALFGAAAVALIWVFRDRLGKKGALVAAAMMAVSPYMLYYSRYARNEAFVMLEGLLMFWATLRYFDTRQDRWLFLFSASLALHFTSKETSFIYTAQLMLFLGGMWVLRSLAKMYRSSAMLAALGSVAMLVIGAGGFLFARAFFRDLNNPELAGQLMFSSQVGLGLGLIALGSALFIGLCIQFFRQKMRTDFPEMDLLLIAATLTFPQLVALPLNYLGITLETLPDWQLLLWLAGMLLPMLALGVMWDSWRWFWATVIGFGIMVPLFTTFFTPTGSGISGLASSLDYWLDQQSVQRGNQPWYFYLIQLSIYEFLPIVGVLLAGPIAFIDGLRKRRQADESGQEEQKDSGFPLLLFLGFYIITANLAYAVAGEKMPWLTVHIALPMILLSGWAIGWVLDRLDFKQVFSGQNLLFLLLILLLSMAVIRFGNTTIFPPEAELQPELESAAQELGRYFSYAIVAVLAGVTLFMIYKFRLAGIGGLLFVLVIGGLYFQTARASFRAAFVNYDEATEFLVYAHSGSGPKQALAQIQELSERINGDLSLGVAYDDITTYPFWWYLRDFSGSFFYGDRPTRQLLDYPLILAGDGNWARVEGLLRDRYYQYEYTRIWWPMEEYRNLTWERIQNAIISPEYRKALWDIWFERDYTAYAALIGQPLTLQDWALEQDMKLYIRKDIANLLWSQGAEASIYQFEDPYADAMQPADPLITLGGFGQAQGQFSGPRDIALAPDGSLYVADTFNHRIQHISPDGEILHVWGAFSPGDVDPRPPGTFNEPWGVAVAPDGTVFVADTWNNRIQHFQADGEFIEIWDQVEFEEAEPFLYGPRAVVVDDQGRVFVADTGNKRIVVFNLDGQVLSIIGGPGPDLGQLEEPVGLAINPQGQLYVADTWNGRVQFFSEDIENIFRADFEVRVEAWFGQSLDNKPYLASGPSGEFCVTDPIVARVLCFDRSGRIRVGWDVGADDTPVMMLPVGIAIDDQCQVWVADAGLSQVMAFDPGICIGP